MLKPIFRTKSLVTRTERNQILEFLDTLEQTKEIRRLESLLQIPTSKQPYIDYVDRETIDLLIMGDKFECAINAVNDILDLNDLANFFADMRNDLSK